MNNISCCQLVEGTFLYQTIAQRPFWFSWDMILLSSSIYLLAIMKLKEYQESGKVGDSSSY